MLETLARRSDRSSSLELLRVVWAALAGRAEDVAAVTFSSEGTLESAFAVNDLAAASIGAAGLAVAELLSRGGADLPAVEVDRRLASLWFGSSIRPIGWSLPPLWDPIAGDYEASDGWIRLHTNAPHHRDAVLSVLAAPPEKEPVAAAVKRWRADDLEAAVVEAGGCAAAMRTREAWRRHPQGQSVAAEPLMSFEHCDAAGQARPGAESTRPLAGVRVLDLTRVLAGPVATRFLAGFGAEVLRIDPPWWEEPAVIPEVALGKRCARLDLSAAGARERFAELLGRADVLVHGYRPGALDRLGFDADSRRRLNPGLIDVSLDAYGWSGPWCRRRGFDSLVQMSSGIAAAGMRHFSADRPRPLPVQALDHATGYLLAAAAVRGLAARLGLNKAVTARTSLARTAELLISAGAPGPAGDGAGPACDVDFDKAPEETTWGPALRLRPPLSIGGTAMRWSRPASALGTSLAEW